MGPVEAIFEHPAHPYTRGLMRSLPRLDTKGEKLQPIPGIVPGLFDFPRGCRFSTRCDEVLARCENEEPELLPVGPGHWARCHLVTEGQR
jgi:oligopeptide/dipeptide ABC transporter ATP-binding protein